MNDFMFGQVGAKGGSRKRVAYEKLLDLLLSGTIVAGTSLQERKLAEQLGISRTPIREALARLEAEGLLTSQGTRSPVVSKIEIQDFIETLKVRKLLEVEAAGLAAENGLDPVAAARTRESIATLLANPDPTIAEHWAVDDQVHGMISEAARNKLLASMILDLRRRTHIFHTNRIPERRKPGSVEHLAIIEAIEARSPETARELMAGHIEAVKVAIINKILNIG